MYCTKCGYKNSVENIFCVKCGERLQSEQAENILEKDVAVEEEDEPEQAPETNVKIKETGKKQREPEMKEKKHHTGFWKKKDIQSSTVSKLNEIQHVIDESETIQIGKKNTSIQSDVPVPLETYSQHTSSESHTIGLEDFLNSVVEEKNAPIANQSDKDNQELLKQEPIIAQANSVPPVQTAVNTGKTVAFYGSEKEPVTGWLVCVKGVEIGVSYPLKTGQNYIGRNLNMDVALYQENSVSRVKHAIIIFEPKKGKFIIQSGEGSGLTYVNDELLLGYAELKAYDVLDIGECKLIFVPFCGDLFTWDKYLMNE